MMNRDKLIEQIYKGEALIYAHEQKIESLTDENEIERYSSMVEIIKAAVEFYQLRLEGLSS